ncbi:MAG: transporter substrate-binding protein [Neobacillus sp.]|jgi:raffinose/stachyose/melibiose transport system substrate-binding protein|nr:transporter substrate-binding protein [Neobacillus sp.]
MNKKIKLAGSLLLTVAIFMTGCSSPKTTDAPATVTTAPAATATTAPEASSETTVAPEQVAQIAGGKEITLVMLEHANEATNNAMKELNDAFTAKYPNVKVESHIVGTDEIGQATQTGLAAGNIDIFEFTCYNITNPEYTYGLDVHSAIEYINNGDIMDLSSQGFVNNWSKGAQTDAMSFGGKVWSIPTGSVGMNGIFYNKQIFADNGLVVPKTWDEFMNLCQKLSDKGIAPMTTGGKDGWPVDMILNGLAAAFEDPRALEEGLWTGTRKWNDAATFADFDRMNQFINFFEEGITSVDYASVIGRFIAGKAAMLPDGSWQAANIELADPEFDYGFFTFPSLDGSYVPMMGKYDICYSGSSKSENQEAILAWMDFYSQKETYTKFITAIGFIPAMDGITLDTKFMKEAAGYVEGFGIPFNLKKPKGLGQYGGFKLMTLQTMGGDVADLQTLVDLAQKDWEDALAANAALK